MSDDTVKAAPVKLCKTVDMKTEGSMSDSEKAKLSAMIGSAHAQSMKAYSNQSGVSCDITEAECSAQTTLVFNGCSDSTYTLKAYAAKIFIQNCENTKITIAPEAKVLTETVEVHRCIETKLIISSRIGTLQMDQCVGENRGGGFDEMRYIGDLIQVDTAMPSLAMPLASPSLFLPTLALVFLFSWQIVRPPSLQTNASVTHR